jgi:hypothetical protein
VHLNPLASQAGVSEFVLHTVSIGQEKGCIVDSVRLQRPAVASAAALRLPSARHSPPGGRGVLQCSVGCSVYRSGAKH